MSTLPRDGLVAVVKRDCPTCVLTAPVLGELARRAGVVVYSQDDPTFPETVPLRESDLGLDVFELAFEPVEFGPGLGAGHGVTVRSQGVGTPLCAWAQVT